jgi:hypothetical protein
MESRVLDGSSVILTAPLTGFGHADVTTHAVFRVAGRGHEFVSGPRAFAAADADSMGVTLDESYSLVSGGVIRVGSAERLDESSGAGERVTYGAWEGDSHSVRTVLYGTASSADVIGLFDEFEVQEAPTGVGLRIKDSGRVSIDRSGPGVAPCVTHRIIGFGLLEVAERTTQLDALAGGLGEQVPGGELFVDGVGTRQPTLLLLSGSARTRVYLEHGVEEAVAIAGAATIQATWQSAG